MTNSTDNFNLQRRQLADYLTAHRETILNRWRLSGTPDNDRPADAGLTREESVDSLPVLLLFFTQGIAGERQEQDLMKRAYRDQIHRWQCGYLLTDFDRFYDSLDVQIQLFLEHYSQTQSEVIALAYSQLRQLEKTVNQGVTLPVDQLQKNGVDEQVKTLQATLESLQQVNSQQIDHLRQVTHDMHSYLGIIATAASLLQKVLTADDQAKYRDMISRNVNAANQRLNQLLTDAQAE